MPDCPLDLDLLLKLRLVVGRFGEMDVGRWWNTHGQLGRQGATTLRRGFPRTHRFARARSVFAVAAAVSAKAFNHPGCVTLWRLPPPIEEAFDSRWEQWIEAGDAWSAFFDRVERIVGTDLAATLAGLELVGPSDLEALARLRRSAEGRAVPLTGSFSADDATITKLALGFARGEPGALAVPYALVEG